MRRVLLLPILALGLATLLGGCVWEPDGYGYGYGYGYPHEDHDRGGWGHREHDRDRW